MSAPANRTHTFASFLDDQFEAGSDTPDQRWLREVSENVHRAHAEMLAERDADERSLAA